MVMTPEDAEEFTQTVEAIGSGWWRQIAWADRQGIPAALGLTTREWVEQRIGGYVRLSIPERREAVVELTEEGLTQREVAEVLGVGQKTVDRDLRAESVDSAITVDQEKLWPAESDDSPPPPAPLMSAATAAALETAAAAAAGPERPAEPPQWSRLRHEAHDMTLLARRLLDSIRDLPAPSEASFVGVSVLACRDAAQQLTTATSEWMDALDQAQPTHTPGLRSVPHA